MSLTITTAKTEADLQGILQLQKRNLARQLNADEIRSQGFVTVDHSYEQLKALNDIEPHVIAREGTTVVGYVLAMTARSAQSIPVLVPLFNLFDQLLYRGKEVAAYQYMVVGQVCIDKAYRSQGLFEACYRYYREHYTGRYDFAITEIAAINLRSLRAHEKTGFRVIHQYTEPGMNEWQVVLWDWMG